MANQHVVPNNGQWQVKRENSTRATKNFNTQKEAISYARNIAINQPGAFDRAPDRAGRNGCAEAADEQQDNESFHGFGRFWVSF